MEKAFKYRIYPNKKQRQLIAKTCGCARFVYNYFLEEKINRYQSKHESISYVQCAKEMAELKKHLPWLKEVDSIALQSALKDLDRAFQKFFNEKTGFPKFKSKKIHRYSYQTKYVNGNIEYKEKRIKLPKLGTVKTKNKLVPEGRILNATVSQEPSGKYYVSLCCTDVDIPKKAKTGASVGIDLGIKEFAIMSDGLKIQNPKYLKHSMKKLVKLQKELSRKSRGSANWNKSRIKVARLQEHIANQRKDFLQKQSTEIVNQYDVICVENLAVSNMMKNRKLAQAIADVSWSEFNRMLKYKTEWYGKEYRQINRYTKSSQLCHVCGYVNSNIKNLSIREWTCPICGTFHDRDVNAAKNILSEGLKIAA